MATARPKKLKLPPVTGMLYLPGSFTRPIDFASKLAGRCLEPHIRDGEHVLCLLVDPKAPIVPGAIYCILGEVMTAKALHPHPIDPNLIKCVAADGWSGAIPRERITQLGRIVAVLDDKGEVRSVEDVRIPFPTRWRFPVAGVLSGDGVVMNR